MPGLAEGFEMLFNQPPNVVQFFGREQMIRRQLHGPKPKLARLVLAAHVHALVAVEAVEVEPYGPGMLATLGIQLHSSTRP